MGEIGDWSAGSTPSRKEIKYYQKGIIPWLKTGDLNDSFINETSEFITELAIEENTLRLNPIGSVLIAMYGATIGKLGLLNIEATTNQACCACIPFSGIKNRFLFFYLLSQKQNIQEKAEGGAQPNISKEKLISILFPLPPLSEQRRIVEKIEELLALVDDLETNKTDLQSYIKQTKSKVLEMAVRGELVPQNPEDESASVLLERIKKEKPSSKSKGKTTEHNTHYEEELLFDIPENWVWCRLGEITMINPKNNIEDNKEVSFIPMTLISDGFSNKHSYEVRLWGEVKKGFTHFQEGDIGIAKITPCFENRKSVIFSNLVNEVGAGTTELHILRPFAYSEIKKYIYWFINTESFIQRGISHFSGAVGQQRVGKDILENTLIPLPPLAEQKRIVEKIEEIFSELEFIEETLI